MIALDWATGTRTTSTIPLIDPDTSAGLCWEGDVVTLTIRWPDDPVIARERNTFFAAQETVAAALATATASSDIGALITEREGAIRAYAAALVCGWSVPVDCTRDGVLDLFGRAPFALALVVDAAGDAERFLPESLRASRSASAPSSPDHSG